MTGYTFPQLIDFTRTSAATFVNSSGNIASTPQSRNLLTFTNEFSNAAWTKTNAEIAPNVNPAAATLGAELVSNGDFASDTVWTKGDGWSIAAGVATRVSASFGSTLSQPITVVAGRLYAVTYTISGYSAGSVNSSFSGGTTVNGTSRAANGTYTEYLVAAAGNTSFALVCGAASAAMSIDNVSVREVIGGALQAPDGTFTADTIVATGAAGAGLVRTFASAAAAYTFSIYLKQGNTSFSEIEIIDQGTVANRVRLTYATGALTVVGGSPTGTATSVGNGWWRVTITYTFPATGAADTLVVYPSTTTGSVGQYCFIWGAQLEQASAATDYTRNFGGLFPPRFDYDPVTRAPRGLLIEEQRTNLVTGSDAFDSAQWTRVRSSVTANATTSPDGTANADKLVEDTASGTHAVVSLAATIALSTHTGSVYAKAAERNWLIIGIGVSTAGLAYFNLSTGTVGTVTGGYTATITPVGNGWYRCTITGSIAASASSPLQIYAATADNVATYTGDGTSGIFIWGAQLEAGAFATSYIPTVASQVTRTADVADIMSPNFASWFNNSEGTLLVEADSVVGNIAQANRPAAFSDGGASNTLSAYIFSALRGASVSVGGVSQADLPVAGYTANAIGKWALAYKVNDFALSVNGAAALTDTSGTVPTLNRLSIGSLIGVNFLNGHVRSLRFYPTRLTNAQLQALTA